MSRRHPSASTIALALLALAAASGVASAGHRHPRHQADPTRVGYATPIQRVYQYPGRIVDQPTSPSRYAAPIQRVYQFPAVIVNQPGAIDPFAAGNPAAPW